MATVVVEDEHYGLPGRLHTVVELSDGSILTSSDAGFVDWDGTMEGLKSGPLVTLSGANELHILEDLDLQANGVANLSVYVHRHSFMAILVGG